MFWGLIMEPNKRYTQTVEKSFHVSMASLDAATADNSIVQVMLCYDERNYLLCSLKKDLDWQVPLDLNFQEGTKIAFTSNGRGHVHLTGYLIPEEEDDLDLDALEEEDEEEDDEVVPQLVAKQPKRKANDSSKDDKKVKRLKAVLKQEESSDDEENDIEEEEEMAGEVEDDSDEEAEDDDDEEDEEDSEDEEEEPVEIKPQQKKNKQKEQQQQKVSAKQEKQKLVNGKDATAEPTKQQTKKNKAEQQQQTNNQQVQKKRIIEGGVQVEDLKTGNGRPAKSGKNISVYYVGRLKNGKQFDCTTQGDGFKFRLGKGEVIKGWDVGIAGMKVGGKRRITIPPQFAYGAKGSPPTIPGNSTLIFEVELKNVH